MTPPAAAPARSPFRSTGYGALAGSLAGTGLSLALLVLWASYALRPGGSLDGAFAVTARVSGLVSLPALLVTSPAATGGPLSVAQAIVIGLPLVTWLVVGTLAGAVVDVMRAMRR